MEYNDIYDQERCLTGRVHRRGTRWKAGEYGLVVCVWVYDGEGNAVKFSDFAGKSVVINFWATWCGYSVKEMPSFEKAFAEYGDEIVFMMIDVTDGYQETKEDAMKFIEEKGYTFPVYYDTDLSAAGVYGASSLPATAFINAEGELVHGQLGMMSEESLFGYIEKLLEK